MLGEYSYLLDKETPEQVITKLYKLLMNDSVSSETKAWLIAAVTKLMAQAHSSNVVEKLIQEFTGSIFCLFYSVVSLQNNCVFGVDGSFSISAFWKYIKISAEKP